MVRNKFGLLSRDTTRGSMEYFCKNTQIVLEVAKSSEARLAANHSHTRHVQSTYANSFKIGSIIFTHESTDNSSTLNYLSNVPSQLVASLLAAPYPQAPWLVVSCPRGQVNS